MRLLLLIIALLPAIAGATSLMVGTSWAVNERADWLVRK